MNLEKIKSLIEFKKDYDYIANMQCKFNCVSVYRNMLVLLDPDKEKTNIAGIVNEVKSIGFELKDVNNYNDLYLALTNTLSLINAQVNGYLQKNMFDKEIQKQLKKLFREK